MTEAQRSKTWPAIGVMFSTLLLGLFLGGFIGGVVVPKSDGLAGAAEVLLFAMIGALMLLAGAIVFVRRATRRGVVRALVITGPVALVLLAFITFRFIADKAERDRQWQEEQERFKRMRPTAPATDAIFASFRTTLPTLKEATGRTARLGLGMAAPHMGPGVFHFYAAPDLDALPDPANATDSLSFEKGEHFTNITSAPPWFVPAHMKLDYDLLLVKVITLARNWVEVEVNAVDGTTRWVARGEVEIRTWPEFITTVNTVEILDPTTNPVRIKPLDHAAVLADGANALLVPLAVQGDWLMVSTNGLADRIVPTGWIRWRKGEELLVKYNLLC